MTFEDEVAKFVREVQDYIAGVLRAFCRILFTAIIDSTPVLTGKLRGNWQVSLDNSIDYYFDYVRPREEVITELTSILAEMKPGSIAYLTNNAPYVLVIEFEGHSSVKAPNGMARIHTVQAERYMQQAIAEVGGMAA